MKFTKEAGAYAGMFVRDADMNVAKDLKACGALVALRKIRHKYPLCWRSAHRLVWLARRGWFYKLEKLDQMAVDAANNVEYFYEPPKNRFLAIVGESTHGVYHVRDTGDAHFLHGIVKIATTRTGFIQESRL